MIGQTLGHYRILEQIGAGGMGVVYRARDERLDRDIALKVLPAGLLADETARKRFRTEALALSKLNHPNIATVHDFDSADGTDFLVMEYIPGVTLSDKLTGGALPEKEILRLGTQLAEGLAAAHLQDVVHRDLKPRNLRVTPDGWLKILDFGLAKLMRPLGEADVTASVSGTHVVAGTLAYMAPEQLRDGTSDARTDIYAIGNVLYEMAAGRRPFEASRTSTGLSDDILHRPPPPPRSVNPRVPAELERIIQKCLEKDPENRYQSAKEIGVDLRRMSTPSDTAPRIPVPAASPGLTRRRLWVALVGATILALLAALLGLNIGEIRDRLFRRDSYQIRSLAVLPLENLSGDPQQEYFADGMTEALIAELSRIRALKVISRTSVMQFKGTKKPLPEVARALNVDAVIEGSVMTEGHEVRITVQLIHANSDTHLWAESYVREIKSILSLQAEVAQAIAKQIRVTLTPEEVARFSSRGIVDPEAHILTLRGRQLLAQVGTTPEGIERSIELFQQAIRLDPQSAPAHAGLAVALIGKSGSGYAPMLDVTPLALNAAEKAIALDPTLGEAFAARATAKLYGQWDWAGADKDYRTALELSPNSGLVLDSYADFLIDVGRFQEGVELGQRAVEADPLNIGIGARNAQRLLLAGRPDEALAAIRKVLTLSPDDLLATFILGVILSERKQYDEAITAFLNRKVPTAATNWALGYTYARAGQKEKAQRIIDFLVKRRKERYVWASIIAHIYIALGEKDKAFEYLEQAFREHDFWMRQLQVDPRFGPVRSDPRFQDLLRRMNFPK